MAVSRRRFIKGALGIAGGVVVAGPFCSLLDRPSRFFMSGKPQLIIEQHLPSPDNLRAALVSQGTQRIFIPDPNTYGKYIPIDAKDVTREQAIGLLSFLANNPMTEESRRRPLKWR